jgi:hypothetical protein
MTCTKSDLIDSFYNNFWSDQGKILNLLASPLEIIPNSCHDLKLVQADMVNRKILQFLKQA